MFRDQGVVSGERHVEISNWFGPCESTFFKHHRSPHPDVFRVSNDRSEGCTGELGLYTCSAAFWGRPQESIQTAACAAAGVGRTGWHIDGSFQPAPFSHALYHIVSCPTQGDTGGSGPSCPPFAAERAAAAPSIGAQTSLHPVPCLLRSFCATA